jgi:hypothetical protein
MAATVLGYTTTHESWNVWLIGDSRRWTAGLLTVIAVAMFGLVARHIGIGMLGLSATFAAVMAVLAFWTASLTPLSLLAASIILAWAVAVVRDLFVEHRKPVAT